MSARFTPAGAVAPLYIVSSAESQSFQRIAITSRSLTGVDGETRCGSYEVFEDRRAREGRRIALQVAVPPAPGPKPSPDALFVPAGGPGQTATENADFFARAFTKVREERDIVMVDRRGAVGSNGFRKPRFGPLQSERAKQERTSQRSNKTGEQICQCVSSPRSS
jgi:hypothetical protein